MQRRNIIPKIIASIGIFSMLGYFFLSSIKSVLDAHNSLPEPQKRVESTHQIPTNPSIIRAQHSHGQTPTPYSMNESAKKGGIITLQSPQLNQSISQTNPYHFSTPPELDPRVASAVANLETLVVNTLATIPKTTNRCDISKFNSGTIYTRGDFGEITSTNGYPIANKGVGNLMYIQSDEDKGFKFKVAAYNQNPFTLILDGRKQTLKIESPENQSITYILPNQGPFTKTISGFGKSNVVYRVPFEEIEPYYRQFREIWKVYKDLSSQTPN